MHDSTLGARTHAMSLPDTLALTEQNRERLQPFTRAGAAPPARAMSRSTIWRILDHADLKPHRSVYWLNSHDPDFEAKARAICQLYVNAPSFYQQGRLAGLTHQTLHKLSLVPCRRQVYRP